MAGRVNSFRCQGKSKVSSQNQPGNVRISLVDVLRGKGRCWPDTAGPHAYKKRIPVTKQIRPDENQRFCDQGERKRVFLFYMEFEN